MSRSTNITPWSAVTREALRLECEETLYIVMRAYKAATGEEIPADAFTGYPEPVAGWDFDFDDRTKMKRRLPRLTALCWPDVADGGTGETSS